MNSLQAVLLGVVQGVTEFLPISSSGHLVLGKAILGVQSPGVAYEICAHLGTFLAIITVFWSDILDMVKALGRALRPPASPRLLSLRYNEDPSFRWGVMIVLGTIPAAVIGLLFENAIEAAFSSPVLVCLSLIATGGIVLGTRWARPKADRFGMVSALLIGCAQAVAILPGISRSGTTIAAALYLGVERSEAARFSFLLALPAILGASVLEGAKLYQTGLPVQQGFTLLIGMIVAYITGSIALKWLLGVIRHGRLDRFSYYCFAVGLGGLMWFVG